jgi:hypothetical protein
VEARERRHECQSGTTKDVEGERERREYKKSNRGLNVIKAYYIHV